MCLKACPFFFPAKPVGLLQGDWPPLPLNLALLGHTCDPSRPCAAVPCMALIQHSLPQQTLQLELGSSNTRCSPTAFANINNKTHSPADFLSLQYIIVSTPLKRTFFSFPKVHVNLLLVEARMQAELLYALRAITRYMTWCLRLPVDVGMFCSCSMAEEDTKPQDQR